MNAFEDDLMSAMRAKHRDPAEAEAERRSIEDVSDADFYAELDRRVFREPDDQDAPDSLGEAMVEGMRRKHAGEA